MFGCWWGTQSRDPGWGIAGLALAVLLFAMAFSVRPPRLCLLPALLLLAGLAGAVAGAGAASPVAATALADHPAGSRGTWRVRGRLAGDPQRARSSWIADIQVDEILVDGVWKLWPLRVRTAIYEPASSPDWRVGDGFDTFLSFRHDRPSRNPLVSPRPPLRASGTEARASLKSFRQLRERLPEGWRFPGMSKARAHARRAIERRFRTRAPLVKALLLGERGEVPADVIAALARTGLIHLIAISGLHVSLVMSALFGLLRMTGVARPRAALLCLGVLPFLYGFVVPRPAVARACLMAALLLAGMASGRRTSALNGLAVATLALTVVDPWVTRDTGFQLSTAATTAILLLCRAPPAGRRIGALVVASLSVSAAAGIGVAPVLAARTHRLIPVSVPMNLAAVPTLSVALIAAMGSLTADAVGAGTISRLLAGLAGRALDLLLGLVALADRHIGALPVPASTVPWVTPTCVAVVATMTLWRPAGGLASRHGCAAARAALAGCCGVFLTGFIASMGARHTPPVEAFRLIAFDIGQGDALLVETPSRQVLIDTGGSLLGEFDPGTSILAPALRARGLDRLDAVAITHLHADHAGGLAGLLREIPADAAWVSSFDPDDPAAARLRRDAAGTPLVSLASGQRIDDAHCAWRVLHPAVSSLPPGGAKVTNDGSLVLSLRCGNRALLLTGDTGASAEHAYLADVDERGSVLKSAHHGSITSSTSPLLDAVGGRHVVVSVGWRNRFGHPDAEVLERYRRRGMAVYRTDRDGAVTLSAGHRIRVRGERWSAGRGRYAVGGWLD